MMSELPQYTWEEISSVPFRNGIYIVFEQGEMYHGLPRIVRIGTHTSPNRLRQRLRDPSQQLLIQGYDSTFL